MKKKNVVSENYLERKPCRSNGIKWTVDDGKVSLEIENTGVFNSIAQKLFKKPRISYIHLDEMGSFVWPRLSGDKTIIELGEDVAKEFGDKANPLYERLVKYFQILESYKFIFWNND